MSEEKVAVKTEEKPKNEIKQINKEAQASINALMRFALDEIEVLLPHIRGDSSENDIRFRGLRKKVLRYGNDKGRLLENFLGDYVAFKVFESQRIEIHFSHQGKVEDSGTK